MDACPNDTLAQKRDRALILLLLSTGARISAILRLDRNDWKPERLWVLGEGDRERVVQVTEKARAAVEDYLTAREDHSAALFIGFQPASKANHSNRLTIAGAQHVCRHLAQQLGIAAFHPTNSGTRWGHCCKNRWATPGSPPKPSGTVAWDRSVVTPKSPTGAGVRRMRRCNAAACDTTMALVTSVARDHILTRTCTCTCIVTPTCIFSCMSVRALQL